jgi:hypothetical protein
VSVRAASVVSGVRWLLAACPALAWSWMMTGCAVTMPARPGATVPWTRYEAEEARANVAAVAATRAYLTPEAESTGRRFMRLAKPGDFVEFAVTKPANGLVLRYSIPDGPDGQGLDASLTLFINGQPQRRLELTSRFSWVYGDFPWTNNPAAGRAHHFFDECQAVLPAVEPGDVIRLQIADGDTAPYYLIDFIELEAVPPPRAPPTNCVSILEFGAVPDDGVNDDGAFVQGVNAAKEQGRPLWIPAGTFILDGGVKGLGGVTIRGAGMWHTRLTGNAPKFHGHGEPVQVSDLAIVGQVAHRNDYFPDNAFTGNLGEGSAIERVWIERVKCGVWSTHGTRNLLVRDCRIRNTMADGVNLCDGTSDSMVENCHLRNTGDDALASWSPSGDWSSKQICRRNRFLRNTVESPWHANGIGLYGGRDHEVRGNLVVDTVQSGGGLLISSGHGACPFEGTIVVESNRFVRTGGDCYIDGRNGGLWIHAHESDIEAPVIIRHLAILDSTREGITLHGPRAFRNAIFEDIFIQGPDESGLHRMPSAGVVDVQVKNLRIVPAAAPPPGP